MLKPPKGEREQPESQQPPTVLVAVVQSLAAHGQYRTQAQEPYELRGQGDHQDGRLFAVEEKGGEGQDLHRDDQREDRQPIGAAADPAVEASPSGEGRLVGLVQLVRNSPYGQP
jgi:hypothetical protein